MENKSSSTSKEYEDDDDCKFFYTEDYETSKNYLLHGWHEGAAAVSDFMGGSAARNYRPQTFNDVRGYACNVGAYLQGSPLCMFNRRKVATAAKTIKIVYNSAVNCDVKAVDLQQAGAKLFNVIAGLQMKNIGVELWVCMINHRNNTQLNCAVCVKSAGDPFNVLQMCYPVVHPSLFRRQMFAVIERAGVKSSGWGGYGHALENINDIKKGVAALWLPTENVFSYQILSGKSEKEIADMIK